MPNENDGTLSTEAQIIRDETTPLANTATRVGEHLLNLIDSKINFTYRVNDTTLAGDSVSNIPTEHAVKTYVDGKTLYSRYTALVTNSGGVFTVVTKQNDFSGVTFAWSIASTGILAVTASGGTPFTLDKTHAIGSTIVSASGVPQFISGAWVSTTVFDFGIWLHDGTQGSTPNFTEQLFEIRVYH